MRLNSVWKIRVRAETPGRPDQTEGAGQAAHGRWTAAGIDQGGRSVTLDLTEPNTIILRSRNLPSCQTSVPRPCLLVVGDTCVTTRPSSLMARCMVICREVHHDRRLTVVTAPTRPVTEPPWDRE